MQIKQLRERVNKVSLQDLETFRRNLQKPVQDAAYSCALLDAPICKSIELGIIDGINGVIITLQFKGIIAGIIRNLIYGIIAGIIRGITMDIAWRYYWRYK